MEPIASTRQLLHEVFPHEAKFTRDDFLQWQYERSPSGPVVEQNADDDIGRLAHYAVVPQRWWWRGDSVRLALSLNTAVSERARGQGLFTKLAEATYAAAADAGVAAILGVANSQSTPGFLGRLGFDLVGPLEVSVIPWRPWSGRSGVQRIEVAALATDEIVASQARPGPAVARVWDAPELAWRLAAPGAQFSIFRSPDWLAVTCATRQKGVPFAVICKVLPADPSARTPIADIAAVACTHHRALAAVYAGMNPALHVKGARVPNRLRPSPLNLIVRSLTAASASSDFVPSTFEFLDFDAY